MGTSSLLHIHWPSTYLWLQNTDSPHIQASYLQRILICHCEHKGRLFFRFQSGKGIDGCSSLALTGSRHIQGRAHLSLLLEPLEHSDLPLVWAKTRMQTSRVLRPGGGEFLHCVINARAPRIFRTSSRLFTLDLPKMHLVTLGSGTELEPRKLWLALCKLGVEVISLCDRVCTLHKGHGKPCSWVDQHISVLEIWEILLSFCHLLLYLQ